MSGHDHSEIEKSFHEAVNMTPAELERWLTTEESRSVGMKRDGASESVGHESGRRIVEIKRTKKADLTDDDYEEMSRVVGYVHRHVAQKPSGDIEGTRWRHSLMNWGHDPLK